MRLTFLRSPIAAFSRSAAAAAVILLACSAAIMNAQNAKVTTPEELDKVMRKAGPAMQGIQKALRSSASVDAKTQLVELRQAILDSQQFWIEKKREDAVKMNKDTLAKIDELDKSLGASGTDPEAATTALKQVGASCRTCHQKFRTTDAEENYILKPGSLDGQ